MEVHFDDTEERLALIRESSSLFDEHAFVENRVKEAFAKAAEPLNAVRLPPGKLSESFDKSAANCCKALNITRHQFQVLIYAKTCKNDLPDTQFLKSRCDQFMKTLTEYRAMTERIRDLFTTLRDHNPYETLGMLREQNRQHRELNADLLQFADRILKTREDNAKVATIIKRHVTLLRPGEEHWGTIDERQRRAIAAYQLSQRQKADRE